VEGTVEFKKEPLKFGECRMFRAVRVGSGFFAILTQRAERLSDCWGDISGKNQRTFTTTARASRDLFFCSRIVLPRTRILRFPPRNEKW
jgi:hypothetical protein